MAYRGQALTTIKSYNKRLESLKSERSSFIPLYRELSDYHLSHRGRFLVSDRNKGHKRNTRQYNNTSRLAARTLASGMMAGITSPARPWFKLAAPDPDMNEFAAVKKWLHKVQSTMNRVFNASNTYNALHVLYSELGVFATAPLGVYEDFENVIWCKPYTVGSYMVGTDGRNNTDTFYQEYEITAGQCVKQFGYDNCSNAVQQMWDTGSSESWVEIVHAIEPNDDRDQNNPLSQHKRFRSDYYEKKNTGNRSSGPTDNFLRQSGFDEFPIMVARWDITGEDIYGTNCPGMDAIGDTKALQLAEKRTYQALDIIGVAPLQGDISLKNKVTKGSLLANEIVWTDNNSKGLTSIYGNYRPDFNAIMTEKTETQNRIKRAFYEDLFLMLSNSDRRQITAREVAEKQEEKLLMLGPVLERLHTDLLDPLIDRTFSILQRAGVLPPPPPELQDQELGVEYISILAQAQRMVSVGGIERVTGFVQQIAGTWPEARHKVDAMQAVDEYAESMGVNPRIVQADDDANDAISLERQQAQLAQAQQMAAQTAETAKTASETSTTGDTALASMLEQAGLQ